MIEAAQMSMGNRYLAWLEGDEPVRVDTVRGGWWLVRMLSGNTMFERSNIVFESSRRFTRLGQVTMRLQGPIDTLPYVDYGPPPTCPGISFADQIVLEMMIERLSKVEFSEEMKIRPVKL